MLLVTMRNLRAGPAVTVEHGRASRAYRAREAEGAERDRLWAHVTAAYPGYQVYADRTDRRIALFVLEPVEGR